MSESERSTTAATAESDSGGNESEALLRSALTRLVAIVERIGNNERYWPRDVRLEGQAPELEAALDEAADTLARTAHSGRDHHG